MARLSTSFLSREDSYKYEWVNGEIVKTKHTDKTQFYILRNIQAAFRLLLFSGKAVGELIPEGDIFLEETTAAQIFVT